MLAGVESFLRCDRRAPSQSDELSRFRLSRAEENGRAPQSRASRKSGRLLSCRSFVDCVVFPEPATELLTC